MYCKYVRLIFGNAESYIPTIKSFLLINFDIIDLNCLIDFHRLSHNFKQLMRVVIRTCSCEILPLWSYLSVTASNERYCHYLRGTLYFLFIIYGYISLTCSFEGGGGSTTTIASGGSDVVACVGVIDVVIIVGAPADGAPGGMTVAAAATAALAVVLPQFSVAAGGCFVGGGGAGGTTTSSSMVHTRSSMGNLKLISLVL
ncbi:hypothetical protein FF38_05646 [Lucilia cuprina]|uniref:Uncharacterized protein n=1 Tax=Lucilia cuprina TaxID=7375 RepID=A0A0L0BY06_LUCCU|nr:hypothetical protein FF38_05646 [Lucilia cuprina]